MMADGAEAAGDLRRVAARCRVPSAVRRAWIGDYLAALPCAIPSGQARFARASDADFLNAYIDAAGFRPGDAREARLAQAQLARDLSDMADRRMLDRREGDPTGSARRPAREYAAKSRLRAA